MDLPIIAELTGIDDTDTATPTPGSPFSWSDAHSTCANNNPTVNDNLGYCTNTNDNPESYLQVDLRDLYDISSVGIKGRGDHPQWVKTYSLLYSTDAGLSQLL